MYTAKLDKLRDATKQHRTSSFVIKCRITKHVSGLKFIKFDLLTGGQEIKIPNVVELRVFSAVILSL